MGRLVDASFVNCYAENKQISSILSVILMEVRIFGEDKKIQMLPISFCLRTPGGPVKWVATLQDSGPHDCKKDCELKWKWVLNIFCWLFYFRSQTIPKNCQAWALSASFRVPKNFCASCWSLEKNYTT